MTDDLAPFWIHPVTVERFAGTGAYGLTYDAPVTVTGLVDDGARLVVNASGDQVTATGRVLLPASTADVPVQSKVTLPATFGGRHTEVIVASRHDSASLGLPDHLELALQ